MNRAQILTDIVLSIFRANGLLLAWGDKLSAPLGLTSARWQMLGALALAPEPLAAPQIAAAMGVSRQGAQKQLDLLEEAGFVERMPNPAHRRSPLYRLARAGKSAYGKIDERWKANATRLAGSLGKPGDLEAASRVVAALVEQLSQDLGPPE